MITFRLRSICNNSFNVSIPFNSGISTSRIIKSGRSPLLIFSIASEPLLSVSTSNPSTSRSVCKYLRMLGSSSTTRIFSFTAISRSSLSFALWTRLFTAQLAIENGKCCLSLLRFPPRSSPDELARAALRLLTQAPCRRCFDRLAQNPQISPGGVPERSRTRSPKRSLPRYLAEASGICVALALEPLSQHVSPRNAVPPSASLSHPQEYASANCPADSPQPAALSDSRTGKL